VSARIDPLVSAVQCEILDLPPRNADVPEVAVWQRVQSGPQPGALAPLLKGTPPPLEEGGDLRRQLGGLCELRCGHGGISWRCGCHVGRGCRGAGGSA